jgi:hypothetical protein
LVVILISAFAAVKNYQNKENREDLTRVIQKGYKLVNITHHKIPTAIKFNKLNKIKEL